MYLHESIIWSANPDGLSGIMIYCDKSKQEEVAQFFQEHFASDWSEAEDAVEEEYGDCMEKEEGCGSIATVSVVEDGVKVILGPLYLSYQDGDYIESSGYATKALEKSLKRLLKKYPDVSYEGYIAYRWSDVHCGEAEQWEISSNNKLDNNANKIYPILGEMLGFSMSDTEFWGQMLENLEDGDVDDFKHVLSNLYTYKKWIPEDSIEQLMDIADEVDEDIRSELEDALELLQNGEDIIAKENIDTSCLPDGYMDVLNAVIQSEDASKNAEIDAELEDEDEE